jgi:MFS superfamily sulfate permease-like transporter
LRRKIRYYRLLWLKYDLPAGLSVFFVALPLCMGIALASGAPLYAGILTGIIGGLVTSLISGSALGESGPAAGLTTIVAAAITEYGGFRVFLLTVIVAGLFQLALGILKLGFIANYFPSSVIKGMLAAIGIILISRQVPVAIGYDKPDFWNSGFLTLFSTGSLSASIKDVNLHTTRVAILITLVSQAVLITLQQFKTGKLKLVPAPPIAVLAGTAISLYFTSAAAGYSLKQIQLVHIPENIFSNIRFPDPGQLFTRISVWKNGIIIGLLATLETLLCAEAIDKLDKHNRITPVNREMVAQGIGNILCGLLGALPMTAVIVRGSANVDAGGRTKLSAFTHGLFLLLTVLVVPFLLNRIPYAALAAILIITGYNLTKPKLYRNMWSLGWKQFLPFIITIVIILLTDLLIGVTAGLLIAIYYIIVNNFREEFKIQQSKQHETDVFLIKLNTNVTFLNKVKLKDTLDKIPEYSILTIDGRDSNFIDYDILEIISEFENKARDRHIEVHLVNIERVNVSAIH